MMNGFSWSMITFFGVLVSVLKIVAVAGILEYLICKYYFKFALVVPTLSVIYLLIKIIPMFLMFTKFSSINLYSLGSMLLIMLPMVLPLITSLVIYRIFKNKIKRQEELNKMIVQDL